jgi:hypothetical protein
MPQRRPRRCSAERLHRKLFQHLALPLLFIAVRHVPRLPRSSRFVRHLRPQLRATRPFPLQRSPQTTPLIPGHRARHAWRKSSISLNDRRTRLAASRVRPEHGRNGSDRPAPRRESEPRMPARCDRADRCTSKAQTRRPPSTRVVAGAKQAPSRVQACCRSQPASSATSAAQNSGACASRAFARMCAVGDPERGEPRRSSPSAGHAWCRRSSMWPPAPRRTRPSAVRASADAAWNGIRRHSATMEREPQPADLEGAIESLARLAGGDRKHVTGFGQFIDQCLAPSNSRSSWSRAM